MGDRSSDSCFGQVVVAHTNGVANQSGKANVRRGWWRKQEAQAAKGGKLLVLRSTGVQGARAANWIDQAWPRGIECYIGHGE